MSVDELGSSQQVVAHRRQLLVGVLLEHTRTLLCERRVVLAGLARAVLGQLDEHLAAIDRVAHPAHQAAALEAVHHGRGGRRR